MVRGHARIWNKEILWYIMTAAMIMNNMIIEDEEDDGDYDYDPKI